MQQKVGKRFYNSMQNAILLSIQAFINALKKKDNLNQFKVEQAITGYLHPKKRKYKIVFLY